jgi:uncharacterized membrane protein YoaT (DUF817 family)
MPRRARHYGSFVQQSNENASRKPGFTSSIAKLGSWYLLMTISVVLVTLVHRPRAIDRATLAGNVRPAQTSP